MTTNRALHPHQASWGGVCVTICLQGCIQYWVLCRLARTERCVRRISVDTKVEEEQAKLIPQVDLSRTKHTVKQTSSTIETKNGMRLKLIFAYDYIKNKARYFELRHSKAKLKPKTYDVFKRIKRLHSCIYKPKRIIIYLFSILHVI